MGESLFNRTALLVGKENMAAIRQAKVILFGVGGVGSWSAEGLIRSGITNLTIVDSDLVCTSNINRQLEATTKTIGLPKVDVLRERLLEINPDAHITALQKVYTDADSQSFQLENYDYIIDAIDSLKDKISLILRASQTDATLFSSMGAALKMDPTKIRVAEFWNVRGCPLGAIIRKRMKQAGTLPAKKFLCVYDEEVLENKATPEELEDLSDGWSDKKARVNGTMVHIVSIFGMTLSGLVISDIVKNN